MALLNPFKKAEQPQQPRFNEEFATFVNKEYQRRQTERKPFELQWRLNIEFLTGNQYLDINSVSQTIEEIPKWGWSQEREVFNQIAGIHETRVARLTRQKPLMKTRPASGDDQDLSTSKVSSMLMSSAWHEQSMDAVYNDYVNWLEVVGTTFLKPVWSTRKGRIIYSGLMPKQEDQVQSTTDEPEETANPDDLQTHFAADQQQIEIREGDIDTAIVPAHEFFPDSSWHDGLNLCRSVIHARAYHIDEIEEMWGVRVEPEQVDVITMQQLTSGMGGLGYGSGGFRMATAKMQDHAVLKEYYERPSRKYPKGRFIVVAGNKTLHMGPMPYMLGPDGELDMPFIRTVSIHVPGCFWGKSVIERCIPIQRRYNALRNRKAEYLNLVAIGQWTVPDNAIDEDETELNNEPGNIMKYKSALGKPEPVQWPSLPSSFEREEQSLLAEFTAVSGVSELSRYSEAPTGVKSGVALSIANEQDDTRIALTAARIATSMVLLGKYWLRLYRQFVKEPRILRSVGANRDVEVMEWTKSDLTSDDVFIENAAALAETPAQRRQMVFDLMSAGLFNRPETSPMSEDARQKVFQLLEFGHWESGFEDDSQLQKSRARRENNLMMKGQMAPVMDFDDDVAHIAQHNRQRMQAEYDELLRSPYGPIIDQMFREHIGQHMQRIVQKQLQMAAAQPQPEQGAPQEQKKQ